MHSAKRVKAEIVEVVFCKRCKTEQGDYLALKIADQFSSYRYSRHRWDSQYGFGLRNHENDSQLWLSPQIDCYNQRDELNDDLELHRTLVWYEIQLRIRYKASNLWYEKIIDIDSETSTIRKVKIQYNRKNPSEIVDFSFL